MLLPRYLLCLCFSCRSVLRAADGGRWPLPSSADSEATLKAYGAVKEPRPALVLINGTEPKHFLKVDWHRTPYTPRRRNATEKMGRDAARRARSPLTKRGLHRADRIRRYDPNKPANGRRRSSRLHLNCLRPHPLRRATRRPQVTAPQGADASSAASKREPRTSEMETQTKLVLPIPKRPPLRLHATRATRPLTGFDTSPLQGPTYSVPCRALGIAGGMRKLDSLFW